MNYNTEQNKGIVVRFNRECIEAGRLQSFDELLLDEVVNHSAPPGSPNGVESFTAFLLGVLRVGLSDLKVDILDQIAERDLVATRKKITGIHHGDIFGIKPTGKLVEINVIDFIRLKEGKYAEHW
ncbi:MAG: ester cyclase, partial [Chryseolinea sp.]